MELNLIARCLQAGAKVWASQILCSSFQKGFKDASVAVVAGPGLGEGSVALEYC